MGQGTSSSRTTMHRGPIVQLFCELGSPPVSEMRNLLTPFKDATPKYWLLTVPLPQVPLLSPVTSPEAPRQAPPQLSQSLLLSPGLKKLLSTPPTPSSTHTHTNDPRLLS